MFVARETRLKVHNKKLVHLEPLTKLLPCEVWISIVVVEIIANRKKVLEEVMLINISPLDYTIQYHFTYAFGNHLRVVNAKWHFSIQDLGVATMFEQKTTHI